MPVPTAPVAAGSMLASYLTASRLGSSSGALVLMGGGLGWSARSWNAVQGPRVASALAGLYLAAFGLSHPLAKRIGAWPAVLAATAATGLGAHLAADRR